MWTSCAAHLAAPLRTPSRALFPRVAPHLRPLLRLPRPWGGPEPPAPACTPLVARARPAVADRHPRPPRAGYPPSHSLRALPAPGAPAPPPRPPRRGGRGRSGWGQLPPGRRGLTKTRVFRRAPAAPRPRPGSPAPPRSAPPGPAPLGPAPSGLTQGRARRGGRAGLSPGGTAAIAEHRESPSWRDNNNNNNREPRPAAPAGGGTWPWPPAPGSASLSSATARPPLWSPKSTIAVL